MATKTVTKMKIEQKFKNGTQVTFLQYDGDSDGATGPLTSGDKVTIIGFDDLQEVYNVQREDGERDSLFENEFEVTQVAAPTVVPKKTKASKKGSVQDDSKVDEDLKISLGGANTEIDPEPEPSVEVKAKKEKKAKKVEVVSEENEEEVEVGGFKKTESVLAILKRHGDDALLAATDLAETKERTIFTLGGVLAFIKRNDTFSSITFTDEAGVIHQKYQEGLAGFNTYVKDELGIESRSAAYYVDLYEMFSQVTTEAKIAKIGWTKLRELLPLRESINADNVDEWLDKAKKSSTAELHEKVTQSLVDAGEELHGNRVTAQQTKLTYVVHEDQANTVVQALRKAKDIMGDDTSDSAALVYILSEWMQLSDSE